MPASADVSSDSGTRPLSSEPPPTPKGRRRFHLVRGQEKRLGGFRSRCVSARGEFNSGDDLMIAGFLIIKQHCVLDAPASVSVWLGQGTDGRQDGENTVYPQYLTGRPRFSSTLLFPPNHRLQRIKKEIVRRYDVVSYCSPSDQ